MNATKERLEAYKSKQWNLLRKRIAEQQLADYGKHDDKKYNQLTQAFLLC